MNKKQIFKFRSGQKGFTLVELIIVIAIIALLAAATFVALDPAKRLGDAKNAQRWSDVTAIADAYVTYLADNTGTAPTTTPSPTNGTTYEILIDGDTSGSTSGDSCTASTTGEVIRLDTLVTSGYIGDIPYDPGTSSGSYTDYYFYTDSTGVIKVGACESYNSVTVKVVR